MCLETAPRLLVQNATRYLKVLPLEAFEHGYVRLVPCISRRVYKLLPAGPPVSKRVRLVFDQGRARLARISHVRYIHVRYGCPIHAVITLRDMLGTKRGHVDTRMGADAFAPRGGCHSGDLCPCSKILASLNGYSDTRVSWVASQKLVHNATRHFWGVIHTGWLTSLRFLPWISHMMCNVQHYMSYGCASFDLELGSMHGFLHL